MKWTKRTFKKRNPVAKALNSNEFRQRVVPNKKSKIIKRKLKWIRLVDFREEI